MNAFQDDLDRIYRYLERVQLTGQRRLPPERVLAVTLGLSRARLRGLLARLEKRGLVWRHVGKGTYFGQKPVFDAADVAEHTTPEEVMAVRMVIEPEAARLAALNATEIDIKDLLDCLKEMDVGDYDRFEFWDGHFHNLIVRACGNEMLRTVFNLVQASRYALTRGIVHREATGERLQEGLNEHIAIVTAIRERDSALARTLMRNHLNKVRENYFAPMDETV